MRRTKYTPVHLPLLRHEFCHVATFATVAPFSCPPPFPLWPFFAFPFRAPPANEARTPRCSVPSRHCCRRCAQRCWLLLLAANAVLVGLFVVVCLGCFLLRLMAGFVCLLTVHVACTHPPAVGFSALAPGSARSFPLSCLAFPLPVGFRTVAD